MLGSPFARNILPPMARMNTVVSQANKLCHLWQLISLQRHGRPFARNILPPMARMNTVGLQANDPCHPWQHFQSKSIIIPSHNKSSLPSLATHFSAKAR